MRLTESLLADDRVARLTGFTLPSLVEGPDSEGVLLLLHQALQLVLSLRNIVWNTDPLLASGLLELNDVSLNLGTPVVFWPEPGKESCCLANLSDDGFARSPWRI